MKKLFLVGFQVIVFVTSCIALSHQFNQEGIYGELKQNNKEKAFFPKPFLFNSVLTYQKSMLLDQNRNQ